MRYERNDVAVMMSFPTTGIAQNAFGGMLTFARVFYLITK